MSAKIFIIDEFSPQDTAMMQALYSRSPQSVEEHIKKVKETGSGKFMERFYVGYGHASIADCGSTTIFIEGLSILADKAIQDWPLYSGQETSTRYVDMSALPIQDPVNTPESAAILSKWMRFYTKSQPVMEEYLEGKYPRKPEEDEGIYKKAIKARAFDILRGFLPAGITTQLSWHTNLRQAWDKLCWLRAHPSEEVRKIAASITDELKNKYPQSFSHEIVPEQEKWRKDVSNDTYYLRSRGNEKDFEFKTTINPEDLNQYAEILKNRPVKTGLPYYLAELGVVTFSFLLDFGSFRDVQRHRNGVCRMPLLTTDLGFNSWYLDELSELLRTEAMKIIEEQKASIAKINAAPEEKQYYIAMGFNVPCRLTYGLPAAAYVVELRSGRLVHPTLRKIALKAREELLKAFPSLVLHCDIEPSVWDISRGKQDIVEK